MAQRRFHYDAAFEHYLRSRGIAYVAVDEARKALHGQCRLKNFDFVVYGGTRQADPPPANPIDSTPCNLLVDVKGRKHAGRSRKQLHNWVTEDDVRDLGRWQDVFGSGFQAALVFLYWCEAQPPDALFLETFAFRDRWYALLAVSVDDYRRLMTPRSARWRTVHVPAAAFDRIAMPLGQMIGSPPAVPRPTEQSAIPISLPNDGLHAPEPVVSSCT